jgi:heme-degrading monooxygenase HmoA
VVWARVSTYQGSSEQLDAAVNRIDELPLREMSGFECAYLLIDRSSGKALTLTLWESEDALRESEERANQLRSQVADELGATGAPAIDRYEVGKVIEK